MSTVWYNTTVVAFWLTTMTWLVWTKVLPPLLTGTPPTYSAILARHTDDKIAWDLYWDNRPVGEARSETRALDDGVTLIRSVVNFENLPLAKLSPLRIKALTQLLGGEERLISMSAEAKFEIDPLGRLLAFESSFGRGLLPDPVIVLGTVVGAQLNINVRAGEFGYKTAMHLPTDRPIGDTFSPQGRLPGLRLGQKWTEPVYSPFSPPGRPLDLLRVEVARHDYLVWNGEIRKTLLVVYQNEGDQPGDERRARGRVWVLPDGSVIQQEAAVGDSRLRFVRRPQAVVTAAPNPSPPRAAKS